MPIEILKVRMTSQYIGLNLLLLSIVFSYLGAYEYTISTMFPQNSDKYSLKEGLLKRAATRGQGERIEMEKIVRRRRITKNV